jgi:MFS family permease
MSSSSNWFNRTVLGAGLTSFLADVGYELAVALLPAFLLVLHLPERSAGLVLGVIEGTAEFLSNAAKLAVGWYTDRIGRRKGLVVFGYALTGSAFALCAVAASWPLVLVAKSLAWLGKGIRGPLRNAILADAVDPAQRGKAFGFHRAGDSLGSVLGPLLGWAVIYQLPGDWLTLPDTPFRTAFWFTLVPGLGSAVAFALLVREQRFTPKPGLRLGASVRALPKPFGKFLIGIGMFGLGDFAHTLLILMATADLRETLGFKAAILTSILFYAWRNFWATLAAFPAGWLGDRFGHVSVLVAGYLIGAGTMAGFAVLVGTGGGSMFGWAALFALAGVYLAVEEALEPTIVPELVPDPAVRGTAFGVLATVNGLGDVAASLMVGVLFRYVGPAAGLAYAAILMASGAAWMASIRLGVRRGPA